MTVTNSKRIIQEPSPRGRFLEGSLAVGQTPKPGTLIKKGSDGTWTAGCGATDGAIDQVTVLIEDDMQGKTSADAYADAVSGTTGGHFFAYVPLAGERLYVLVKDLPGTGSATDTHTIGDLLMGEATGGRLLVDASGAMKPFKVNETVGPLTADTLISCVRT